MCPRGLGMLRHCRAGMFAAAIGLVTVVLLRSECWATEENDSATRPQYAYPSPILFDDLNMSSYYRSHVYNWGVIGFQVNNFFSYAAYFCEFDAVRDNGTAEIVSVGTGYGTNEKEIINMHRQLFGTEINITQVNKNPECDDVHFRTVDDLIANRSNIVRNCVLLLIWPEAELSAGEENDDDIEAVRKLQPRALLTLYETRLSISGSRLLSLESKNWNVSKDEKRPKLRKYRIEEAVFQGVNWNPRTHSLGSNKNDTFRPPPGVPALGFRLVKLKRADVKSSKKPKTNCS